MSAILACWSNGGGGESDPRHLWPFIKFGIATVKPLWCWFENVSNHINIGYEQVRNDLCELGYTVKEGIFSAEEVGAPHIRKRLFILALDNSLCRRYRGQEKQIRTGRVGIELPGEAMDNTKYQGLEGHPGYVNGTQGQGGTGEVRSITPTGFPLGQGYEQYKWEEPRTTKPGMGSTVNGYNFREDLLRAYGNSVVEQTAEFAFIELLKKHGIF